jgi:hypothetical protein
VFDRFLAALAHNVSRSESFGQLDSVRVPSKNDDLFCAEPLRSNDAAQADCAVTDYGCFLARTHLCHNRRMMASSHDIGKRQQ